MNIPRWLETAGPVLTDAAIRGALVFVGALVIAYMLRRKTAAARHLVWVGAIFIQLALPLLAVWGPKWGVVVPATVATTIPIELPLQQQPSAAPSFRSAQQLATDAVAPTDTRSVPLSGAQLLIALWAIGAIAVIARLAVGTAFVAMLARRGAAIGDNAWLTLMRDVSKTLGIRRPLALLRGETLGVPITWGILHPVVLLPADSDAWPEDRRRLVLVHELAHITRLDALTQLVGQFALALFWFDPLMWIANHRMQLEREHACDDYVIRHGTMPSLYAEELLSMVRSLGTHGASQPAFAALAMARRSEFEGRMLSILNPVLDRHPLRKGRAFASALAALLVVLPLAALHPYRKADEARPAADSVAPRQFTQDAPVIKAPATTPVAQRPTVPGNAAVASIPVMRASSCDQARFDGSTGTSLSVHSDDNGTGDASLEYLNVTRASCSSASIMGSVKYTADEDDVASIASGASAVFRERTASSDRRLDLLPAAGGGLARTYRRDGKETPYDADAQAWFSKFLPSMLAEVALNTRPRVARWMAAGGVDNVLAHIGQLHGTNAMRAHYEALLDNNRLTKEQLESVALSALRNIHGASYDLRAVLMKTGGINLASERTAAAFRQAMSGTSADYDQAAILQLFGASQDRETQLVVVRQSSSIANDGEKGRLLISIASNVLSANDRAINDEFIKSAATIHESGELSRVLRSATPFAPQSETLTRGIIETSRKIQESGDRARLLISLYSSGAVKSPEVREAFLGAARDIPDESERTRVLRMAGQR